MFLILLQSSLNSIVRPSHVCDSQPSPITNADFLCHAVRATRGDRTLCPEYSLQTLSCFRAFTLSLTAWCICMNQVIYNSQSFSVIHIRHTDAQHCYECVVSNHTRQCNFQVQVDPAVYHSQCFETYLGRTDSHSHHTRFMLSTTTTILASPRVGGARWAWEILLSLASF